MLNSLIYNLLGKEPSGFGLEIEDRSIKAFMVHKGGGGKCRILSCGMRMISKDLVRDGLIINPRNLASEIKELLRTTKPRPISSKFVVFSVPETKAFIRTISIPKMTREEAKEAVKWETEANIPVAADKVYLDWQIVEEGKEIDEVLVAAIHKDVVNNYCETMVLAGLEIMAIEVDIISTIRNLAGEKEVGDKPVMIVDMGEYKTSLAISKKEVPYFTSSIHISGQAFTDALQKGLGISFEKAEELKIKYGLGKMKQDDILYNIYNPLIENLAVEIEKSIVFYEDSINVKEKVERIIFSGGGALLRDLADYMAGRVKKEVIIGNPLKSLEVSRDFPEDIQKGLVPFATTIGLATRACKNDD